MSPVLTLPLVGLLISFPGLPGLKKLPKFRSDKAVVDTLPPVWKPHTKLALENQFVLASLRPIGPSGVRLKLVNDPRRLQVSVDSDSGTVTALTELGEVPLGEGARVPMDQFHKELAWQNFRRVWADRSRQSVNSVTGGSQTGQQRTGGYSFNLPVHLPKVYHSLLGPGGPAINVSGSENIKLSGTSEWTNQETGFLGQRRSLFPSLDMEQDLDIRLEGQLSDRVKVNLLQNSATQIPLANKIAINYKGDEDDLVQSLDLGNTNLTLPGTQYVSYSGRNEGLFGMKATTRLGPLDFTVLASKQEGKSERAAYAGGASSQKLSIADYSYQRGTYFFFYDPSTPAQNIDQSSIKLYIDDRSGASNRPTAIRGRAFVDPALPDSVDGIFVEQVQGPDGDFEVLNDVYGPLYKVIRLKRALTDEASLAVVYQYLDGAGARREVGGSTFTDSLGNVWTRMKLLHAPIELLLRDADGFFRDDIPMAATRELELRNIYNIGGQDIDFQSFNLTIRRGNAEPPQLVVDEPDGVPVPYIEVLGLDNFNETVNPAVRGHDNKVDGTLVANGTRYFVDYANGTLFFLDPRPFAPRVVDAPNYPVRPFDKAVSDTFLFRRKLLVGDPGSQNERNRVMYDQYNPTLVDKSIYFIDVEFTSRRAGNEINLGRSNIIEGSEAVLINGRRLERDRDYTIDYDLGRVTLKAAPGAADQVNVDYSYAPLFQQAGRTLLGSAFRLAGRDKHLGGAFMYESKGAQDLRPRLGEEPSRVMIGDLNGEWRTRPEFLTRLVDALPGVRTTAPSEFNVAAEVGASFPNPNTYNEVFVDDMEGVRDAVSLALTPERWTWSSTPSRLVANDIPEPIADQKNAEVHWFTPLNAVKERELKPNLTDAQGAQNSRQVLAISVPRRPPEPTFSVPSDKLWVGLTYLLDGVGIDLSRSQFIELWVNDFRNFGKSPRLPGQSLKLHVDLGVVSEDQRRSPQFLPNGALDSEDQLPRDQKLTVVGASNEDTGVDGVIHNPPPPAAPSVEVRDSSLITAGPADPRGDDFESPTVDTNTPLNNLDPARWLRINGAENNKDTYPIPDTEDLNRNDVFETNERYFEYTIDLASSPYLADSVYVDPSQPGYPRLYENDRTPIPDNNGWRRYRIPITDDLRARFGSPDLALARHVRLWVEGIMATDSVGSPEPSSRRPLLMLGGLEIVGSRWLVSNLTPAQTTVGTTMNLNSVNNVDNADIYVPPFDPGSTRNGAQDLTRREQSLELEFGGLLPDDSLQVYKTFSLNEDYTRYGNLRFYAAGYDVDASPAGSAIDDSLFYFLRFASDEQGVNYYEYRAPLPPRSSGRTIHWSDVLLKLTDLSNLKLDPLAAKDTLPDGSELIMAPGPRPGDTLIVKGRPSFTRLRRISTGLLNRASTTTYSGRLWVNEVRATDVARDHGYAQRFAVSGRMANLFGYNFTYNARDEDFLSVGETRGSGNRSNSWTASTNIDVHRFFAGTGIVLPVTLSMSGNLAQPRYTAGDDVVRTGALAEASESRTRTRTWTASYQRTWSERSNPFLRYTLGGITANISRSSSENSNPATVDTSRATAAGVGYTISPRRLLPVPVPLTRFRVYPLPERFYWNYWVSTRSSRVYDRRLNSDVLVLRNSTFGRTAGIDFGADTRPFDLLHHQFQAKRNLTLPGPLMEQIGPINLGKVVQWNQSFSSRYAANRGTWLRPQFNWSSTYFQNNGPELSSNLSIRAINNSETVSASWALPFDQLAGPPPRAGARVDTTRRGPPPLKRLLSHLGAISLDAGFTRSSEYTRLTGMPSLAYFVGLSDDPGLAPDSTGRVQSAFGNAIRRTRDWRTGARTRLLLVRGASVQTNADYTETRSLYNNVINRTQRFGFPNFDVEFGRLPETLGLKLLFTNPKLRSVYSRSTTTTFSNSTTPTQKAASAEWRPLIGFTGDFRNGTRAEFRIQHRGTTSEFFLGSASTTIESNTDVDLSLTRSYTRGQKVTILGKASTMKTNITLGLTGAFSRQKSETRLAGYDRPTNPRHEERLNVNARGSYGFSNNITGNAELGFSQTRDLLIDFVRRSVRVELRAQFNF